MKDLSFLQSPDLQFLTARKISKETAYLSANWIRIPCIYLRNIIK